MKKGKKKQKNKVFSPAHSPQRYVVLPADSCRSTNSFVTSSSVGADQG